MSNLIYAKWHRRLGCRNHCCKSYQLTNSKSPFHFGLNKSKEKKSSVKIVVFVPVERSTRSPEGHSIQHRRNVGERFSKLSLLSLASNCWGLRGEEPPRRFWKRLRRRSASKGWWWPLITRSRHKRSYVMMQAFDNQESMQKSLACNVVYKQSMFASIIFDVVLGPLRLAPHLPVS